MRRTELVGLGGVRRLWGVGVALLLAGGWGPGVGVACGQPFGYQGELREGDVPASGLYDVEFRVYDAASGGGQVGVTSTVTVEVVGGRLAAMVDPGAGVFTGAERWLGISVRRAGVGSFVPLAERQRLSPTPYAIRSLNERWTPGAGGMLMTDGVNTVVGINAAAPLGPAAMLSVLRATSAPGEGCGVIAATSRPDGLPYFGFRTGGEIGGRIAYNGQTSNLVIAGKDANAAEIDYFGRIGIPAAPTGTERVQVTGAVSVSGDAKAGSFTYAVPRTRYLSIPPEAFHPQRAGDPGLLGGGEGHVYLDASVTVGFLYAAVNLPDGATVTGLRAHLIDQSGAADVAVELRSRVLAVHSVTAYTTMASVGTSGTGPGVQTLDDTTIASAVVDNASTGYCILVFCSDWAGPATAVKGVRLTYTVTGPE